MMIMNSLCLLLFLFLQAFHVQLNFFLYSTSKWVIKMRVFFFFWKIKWIKYDWSELKTRLWIKCVRATCRYYDFHFVIRQALFTSLNECYTDWTPRTLSTHDERPFKTFVPLILILVKSGEGATLLTIQLRCVIVGVANVAIFKQKWLSGYLI